MKVYYKQVQKWMLHPVMMGLVAVTAIACVSAESLMGGSASAGEVSVSKSSVRQNPGVYRSDRFGFQFRYSPRDFVVDDKIKTPGDSPATLGAVEIWTQEHARKIRAGAYEGGTEYPANVRVTVSRNPQGLTLRKWVQQSNQFSGTRQFKNTKVAGRNAIAFQSSGLYENEHVAFTSRDGSKIIVITFSKINYGNHDAVYGKAFQQVVNSFTLRS